MSERNSQVASRATTDDSAGSPPGRRRGRRSFIMSPMKRSLAVLALGLAVATLSVAAQSRRAAAPAAHASFTVVEATIPEMKAAMEQGRVTSHELVRQYLARIG